MEIYYKENTLCDEEEPKRRNGVEWSHEWDRVMGRGIRHNYNKLQLIVQRPASLGRWNTASRS